MNMPMLISTDDTATSMTMNGQEEREADLERGAQLADHERRGQRDERDVVDRRRRRRLADAHERLDVLAARLLQHEGAKRLRAALEHLRLVDRCRPSTASAPSCSLRSSVGAITKPVSKQRERGDELGRRRALRAERLSRKFKTMRILVKPVIISSSVGSSVSSPIITTTPTVPLRCSPSPLPTRRSIFGTSGPRATAVAARRVCAAAAVSSLRELRRRLSTRAVTLRRCRRQTRLLRARRARRRDRHHHRDHRDQSPTAAPLQRRLEVERNAALRSSSSRSTSRRRIARRPLHLGSSSNKRFMPPSPTETATMTLADANHRDALLRSEREPLHDLHAQPRAGRRRRREPAQQLERDTEQREDEAQRQQHAHHRANAHAVALGHRDVRDDARDANTEVLAEHDDFTFGEAAVGDVEIDRLAGQSLELHDGAAAEAKDVLHRHARASELDRQRQREIHQHRERHFGGAGHAGAELGEIGALSPPCAMTRRCLLDS